jgi:hypothetical protein
VQRSGAGIWPWRTPTLGVVLAHGLACHARGKRCATAGVTAGPSTGPRTPEGLQRIVKARTVHGAYGAEMRELRRLMRALDEEQRRVLELVK